MNAIEMDTDFATGVRAELAAIGTRQSILQRHQRRSRAVAVGVGAVLLAGATTGAAIAVNGLPGATTVAPLGDPVTVTNTGTAEIDLGPIPANATGVVVDLTCVSDDGFVGIRTIPEGGYSGDDASSGIMCGSGHTSHIDNARLPDAGTTSITVAAEPGTQWSATAQYVTSTAAEWGVNARGQTFGVPNVNGVPDLSAVQATNGEWGYVYVRYYDRLIVNVFASDGRTVVGHLKFAMPDEGTPRDVTPGPTETFVLDDFFDEFGDE